MKKALLFALLMSFSAPALGVSVGATPGSLDLGTVQPGSTVNQDIYITADNIGQNFTVVPYANSVSPRTLFSGSFDNKNEVSEQTGVEWWSFQESRINPLTDLEQSEIEGSRSLDAQGKTTATLEVPSDAEPGYRYGHIRLNPVVGGLNESGSGARVVTPTRLSYSFRVAGDVRRDLVVQDVRAFRLGEESAAVEVLLNNRGTVTTTARNFQIDILDSQREERTTLEANGVTLEPGESQWVDANWISRDGVEEGTYQIDGQVDYLTGQATASGSFSLPGFDVVEVRPADSPGSDEQERSSVPLWLIIMVLILMGVLMWSFGIDPFWILLIVGVLGISAFILMSSISNYLLILLLMVVAIVVYGGL